MTELQIRVQSGVKLLDEKFPDWRLAIEVRTLDVGSCDKCIVGQLFGSFHNGLVALDIQDREVYFLYGFASPINDDREREKELKCLTELWQEELEALNELRIRQD